MTNESTNNKPYYTEHDRGLSVSFFKHDEGGKPKFGVSIQRSYRIKDSNDWKREKISLFLEELLPFAALIMRAYGGFVRQRNLDAEIARQNSKSNFPKSSYDDQTPPDWVSEDVPMEM